MSLDTLDPILSEQELAAWLNTSRPTLQRQRSDGSGPDFIHLSERRIGYRKSAVERWLASRTASRIGDRSGEERQQPTSAFLVDGHGMSSADLAGPIAPSELKREAHRAGQGDWTLC
jgi:predicted DNA-binding transcriptional regulator AlpA